MVGSAWALDPARDWVVPQYRELPGDAAPGLHARARAAVLHRAPGRQPHGPGRQRAALPDLAGRADPPRGRAGVGPAPPGLRRRRLRVLRRRRLVGGRRARGAEPRRRAPRARRLRAQEQRLGDLHAGAQADRGVELRGARGGLRDGGRARRRQRPVRDARRVHACGRAGARGRRADADRGADVPDGPAQHLRRPDALRRRRRARGAPCVGPDRAPAPPPDRAGAWSTRTASGRWPSSCAPRSTPPSPRPRRARYPRRARCSTTSTPRHPRGWRASGAALEGEGA